jgi:hypothetical protein
MPNPTPVQYNNPSIVQGFVLNLVKYYDDSEIEKKYSNERKEVLQMILAINTVIFKAYL